MIAVEQDSGYETIHFEVPEIFPDGQTAYVMFQREDGSTETYMLGADGLWTLTSGLTKVPTKLAVFLRIISVSYTHLDVYKRQALGGAAPQRRGV